MQIKMFHIRTDHPANADDQLIVNTFMEAHKVSETATHFVPGDPSYWSVLIYFEAEEATKRKKKAVEPPSTDEPLSAEEEQVLLALKTWRKEKSETLQLPEFFIFHNATLVSLAKEKPRSIDRLAAVKGMGDQKLTKYGSDVLAILNAF